MEESNSAGLIINEGAKVYIRKNKLISGLLWVLMKTAFYRLVIIACYVAVNGENAGIREQKYISIFIKICKYI